MNNLEIVEDHNGVQHAVITNSDGSFTSMPKVIWDELEAQREQSGTL